MVDDSVLWAASLGEVPRLEVPHPQPLVPASMALTHSTYWHEGTAGLLPHRLRQGRQRMCHLMWVQDPKAISESTACYGTGEVGATLGSTEI